MIIAVVVPSLRLEGLQEGMHAKNHPDGRSKEYGRSAYAA
jgi:hypothetical protein